MGTWLKLADRSVWAHGNTRKGGKKKRKRLPPTGAEPGACAWESSATAAAPPIRPRDALSWFPFYPLRSGAAFFSLPSAYCHVPILSGLPTLAMCPYRLGVWVGLAPDPFPASGRRRIGKGAGDARLYKKGGGYTFTENTEQDSIQFNSNKVEMAHGCCTAVSVLEFVVGVVSGAGVVEGYIVENVEVV